VSLRNFNHLETMCCDTQGIVICGGTSALSHEQHLPVYDETMRAFGMEKLSVKFNAATRAKVNRLKKDMHDTENDDVAVLRAIFTLDILSSCYTEGLTLCVREKGDNRYYREEYPILPTKTDVVSDREAGAVEESFWLQPELVRKFQTLQGRLGNITPEQTMDAAMNSLRWVIDRHREGTSIYMEELVNYTTSFYSGFGPPPRWSEYRHVCFNRSLYGIAKPAPA